MYKKSLRFFGRIGMKYLSGYLLPLREEIQKSNLPILFEIYVGRMILFSILGAVMSFTFVAVIFTFIGVPAVFSLISGLIASITMGAIVLTLHHYYPLHILTSKRTSLEANMPFAINHMAAIASSGVSPFVIFKLISNVKEYSEVTNECSRIVKNIDVFGMDILSATRNVAERTPSDEFRQFLYGIVSAVETGGNLKSYFEVTGRQALFDYRVKREKYLQTLATYADFYTAVLIAAPLFFVSVLSIMSLIGGQVLGMSIPTAMRMGIYVLIPLLNTAFIMFIHYTQPSI